MLVKKGGTVIREGYWKKNVLHGIGRKIKITQEGVLEFYEG
jgi:hypothetical protein